MAETFIQKGGSEKMHEIKNDLFCLLDRWAVIGGYVRIQDHPWPLDVVVTSPDTCTVIWRSMIQRGGRSTQKLHVQNMGNVCARDYIDKLQKLATFVDWFNEVSGVSLKKEVPTEMVDIEWVGIYRYRNESSYNIKTIETTIGKEKSKEIIKLCQNWYMPGGGGIVFDSQGTTIIEKEGNRSSSYGYRSFETHMWHTNLICRSLSGHITKIDEAIKERKK